MRSMGACHNSAGTPLSRDAIHWAECFVVRCGSITSSWYFRATRANVVASALTVALSATVRAWAASRSALRLSMGSMPLASKSRAAAARRRASTADSPEAGSVERSAAPRPIPRRRPSGAVYLSPQFAPVAVTSKNRPPPSACAPMPTVWTDRAESVCSAMKTSSQTTAEVPKCVCIGVHGKETAVHTIEY